MTDDIREGIGDKMEYEFIDTTDWWIKVQDTQVTLESASGALDLADSYVFVRSRVVDSAFTALWCHICKLKGVPFSDETNEYHSDFSDKAFAIPRLAVHGLPVPNSVVASLASLQKNWEHVTRDLDFPLVCKTNGSRGEGVRLIDTSEQLRAALDDIGANGDSKSLITLQEVIENTYDVRALFMGQRCIGVMRRTRKDPDSFLNNISKGAQSALDELSEAELGLCQKAQKVSYIDFCGIDFIRTDNGIVFLEVNKSPQVIGIRDVVPDLSIGRAIVDYVRDEIDKD